MAPQNKTSKKPVKKTGKKQVKKTGKKQAKKTGKKQANEDPTVVVLFFAHWCGHCQAMYPEWEKLRNEYENNNNFILKEIEHGNIEQDKLLLEKEYGMSPIQVQGFPTLAKFRHHQQPKYYESGERTKENLMNWLQDNAEEKVPLDSMKFRYGGYKIPLIGKVRTYSKSKTMKSKSKSKSKSLSVKR